MLKILALVKKLELISKGKAKGYSLIWIVLGLWNKRPLPLGKEFPLHRSNK